MIKVVKSRNPRDAVSYCIKKPYLWPKFSLIENMRMSAAEKPSAAVGYDKWLLTVGDGTNQLSDDFVNLPENKTEIISSSSLKKAVNWVLKILRLVGDF